MLEWTFVVVAGASGDSMDGQRDGRSSVNILEGCRGVESQEGDGTVTVAVGKGFDEGDGVSVVESGYAGEVFALDNGTGYGGRVFRGGVKVRRASGRALLRVVVLGG